MIILDTTDTPIDLTTSYQQIGVDVLNKGSKEIPLTFNVELNDSDKVLTRIETQVAGETTWQPLITESKKLDGSSENLIQEKELVIDNGVGSVKFSIQDQSKKFRVMAKVVTTGATPAQITKLVSNESLKAGNIGGEIQKEINTFQEVDNKIKDEEHFFCNDFDNDVSILEPKYMLFQAPDTTERINMMVSISGSFPSNAELFKAPTVTSTGTPLTIFNNDDNSLKTTGLTCFTNPVVTADGQKILTKVIGSDSSGAGVGFLNTSGSTEKTDRNFILKQNETYLIKITTEIDECRTSVDLNFYKQ